MYVLEMSFGPQLIANLALWPLHMSVMQPHFQLFQLVTYSFLHGSVMHLLLNMYALWLFGSRMENVWGSRAFTIYYFVCVLGAGLAQLLVSSVSGGFYPTIGASGGVFGLLLAFGMRFPNEVLILIFPPVPLKAKWFVTIYAAIELWAGVTGSEAGVAHFAHLGGMLFGFILILYWRRHPP
jgi:membrane associated rhomboid family serine protease